MRRLYALALSLSLVGTSVRADSLWDSILDLKEQSRLRLLRTDRQTIITAGASGAIVGIMAQLAWRESQEMTGPAARVLGYVAVGSGVAGATVAAAAGIALVFIPKPANAGEFSNAFASSSAGFEHILSLSAENILFLTREDPALGEMILDFDQKVRAMQGR